MKLRRTRFVLVFMGTKRSCGRWALFLFNFGNFLVQGPEPSEPSSDQL